MSHIYLSILYSLFLSLLPGGGIGDIIEYKTVHKDVLHRTPGSEERKINTEYRKV